MPGSYDTVDVEYDDGITTITLDRPEKKNAMNPTLHREMHEVIHRVKEDALDPDGGSNVVVLTGAGDSFCAGQDLEEYFLETSDSPNLMSEISDLAMEWGRELFHFPRATIAAVNGYCFGGGMRLLCSCDLAVASENATFGLSEVNFGILPAGGSTRVPSRVLSRRDFLWASLTGQEFGAEEADKWRLVNKVVPHDELMAEVADVATTINDLNPTVVQYAKQVYQREVEDNMSYDTAVDYELAKNRHLRQVTGEEDVQALQAFADRKFKPGRETYTEDDIAEYRD